jgi:hypothetical protein
MELGAFVRDPGGCLVARLDRHGLTGDDDEAPAAPALVAGEVWAPLTSMNGVPHDVVRDERNES